ncbi:MAG: ligase-associated DNA damage response exonuclease [Desulfobacterales bacterium]|jgi:putative mRNA 3-end processing factor|nr:ligase-associated DNA damage response exonuclease [Desulfobacterales bacterium]
MKPIAHLIELTESGMHCREGGFFVDPWRPVERAVVTHAHFDHTRLGCGSYLATPETALLMKARLGPDLHVRTLRYGEEIDANGVRLSLHPAGHILGSAQVRLERNGEVWVVTGDFKRAADPTCAHFAPLRCHGLVTESTFGLPVFRWPTADAVTTEISDWWRRNAAEGRPSLLLAYSLGKAQRILAGVDASIGPIFTHGAIEPMTRVYREAGISLPPTRAVAAATGRRELAGALVLAPPAAEGSAWTGSLAKASRAFASGWMQIRGNRRRRALDRGFVLSDHADWSALLQTVAESRAERVWITHGYAEELARFFKEKGLAAEALRAGQMAEEADA